MDKQKIQISDIYRFKLVSDPQISPDGSRVVFVVETMHKADKKYYMNLWLVPSAGGRARKLSHGKKNDTSPRWSPDGETVAFISKRNEASQIWFLPMAGGEARQLTKLPKGKVSSIRWSPHGKEIGFLFHPFGKEVTFDKKGKPEMPVYRHIRDMWYRFDGEGFFDSEFTHVWVANATTGAARQVVKGEWHDTYFDWSPDGRKVAFISNRRKEWQHRLEEDELYLVSAKGSPVRRIPTPAGPKEGLSFSPDGKRLAFFGHTEPYSGWGAVNYTVRTIGLNGKNYRSHTGKMDRMAFPVTLGDLTPSFVVVPPAWNAEGRDIYFTVSSEGGSPLCRVDTGDGGIETVTDEKVVVSFSLDSAGQKLVLHGGQMETPDEIYTIDLRERAVRQVSRLNQPYVRSRQFNLPEEVWFKSGRTDIHGWILKPPGFSTRRKYPFILQIHGGPRCQYGRLFFHEMHVLAAAGYVVMYTNPRGSQGYGYKFADAITGKWAEPAFKDLMAAVDYAFSLGYIDEKRMGVTGGSYGGYMTNWIVTHTNRFSAAVTQRSVSDLSSMFGTSDLGFDMAWEFKTTPWDCHDLYRKWSPISYIKQCRTPLLIIHSEHDWRCNVEQDDQMYMALKFLKREVEYVRFPEEPHGLSRHGRPDRREARLKFMVGWFDRYLK
ncbi:MAG: S9 family peptidase [Candidatus Marinimicrobia bacterium]|nr:S9 family peptidase [Candidatus Neomarinimicrobiota bacterium]